MGRPLDRILEEIHSWVRTRARPPEYPPSRGVGPAPITLHEAYAKYDTGEIGREDLEKVPDTAVKDSIGRLGPTGSPIISDREQRWPSPATHPIAGTGLDPGLGPDGQFFAVFADGRRLPKSERAVPLQPARRRPRGVPSTNPLGTMSDIDAGNLPIQLAAEGGPRSGVRDDRQQPAR